MQTQTIIFGIVVAFITRSFQENHETAAMPEPSFYRALSLRARQLGIELYVFAAESYLPDTGQLYAYYWEQDHWALRTAPLPDIVYDRCFFTNTLQQMQYRSMLDAIRKRKPHLQLNGSLPAKLGVYEALKNDPKVKAHLPETERYQSSEQLEMLLSRHPDGVVLKPSAGMQGRGLIRVQIIQESQQKTYSINGRTRHNRIFTLAIADNRAFRKWLHRFMNNQTYLIQPYLKLSGEDGKPYDVRALLQKDDNGRWTLTGTAIRSGQTNSLTSNLHGGGGALPAEELLSSKFGMLKAERLLEQIHTISKQAADRLESRLGRFAELGFDYGIEPDGRLWLLEVNSKPGRTSFRMINDKKAVQHSIEKPLLYAIFLSRRLYPTFAANESANGRHPDSKSDSPLRSFNVQEVHR